jgi:heat shock protein HtpX
MPMNYVKTAMLLVLLTGIFIAVGAAVGGQTGIIVAFVAALALNLFSFYNSDTMVLRMFKAQEVDERSAPEYYGIVREMAQRAELPMPRVYVVNNPQPNAFATGRSPSRSAVAASTGLLDMLSREEIAGVMAHELAHIKNRDTLTMTMAATIGGAISMFAQYLQIGFLFGGNRDNGNGGGIGLLQSLVIMFLAPFSAGIVQMAISRSREYQADRLGALICGNPRWLASALTKIHAAARRIPNMQAERVPAAAHVFIVNPLSGRGVDNWFSTHPNIENRLAELEALARELGQISQNEGFGRPSRSQQTAGQDQPHHGPWSQRRDRSGPWG